LIRDLLGAIDKSHRNTLVINLFISSVALGTFVNGGTIDDGGSVGFAVPNGQRETICLKRSTLSLLVILLRTSVAIVGSSFERKAVPGSVFNAVRCGEEEPVEASGTSIGLSFKGFA
jgi:hypothetical protein